MKVIFTFSQNPISGFRATKDPAGAKNLGKEIWLRDSPIAPASSKSTTRKRRRLRVLEEPAEQELLA